MNHIVDKSGSMRQALANEIRSGVYRENSKLPGERRLCEYFKVSRTTARVVLDNFEKAGIIIRKPRSGAFVTSNALELIEQDSHTTAFRVFFIMLPSQQVNPLINKIFKTFLKYINPQIKASVLFQNRLDENISYLTKNDVAVVFGISDKKQLDILDRQVAKVIVLNQRSDKYAYISPDNYYGGKIMAEYLLENGHKKIFCPVFCEEKLNSDMDRRYQGLKEVLEANNATIERHAITYITQFSIDTFEKVLKHFCDLKDFTAIACMNDKIAMNLYAQINTHKLEVPNDVSVVGFDDQYYAQYACPPLSTVQYPAEALGIHFAKIINNSWNDDFKDFKEIIEPILIKRQSVKNIK